MPTAKTFFFLLLTLAIGCAKPVATNQNISENQPAALQITDQRAIEIIKIKDSVAPFFKPMGEPEEYDWLAHFKEPGQTFEEYVGGNPTLPTAERQVIYIQPVGEFTPTQRKVLTLVADYMRAFYSLPVKLNEVRRLENVPADLQRKLPTTGVRQIRTTYFIDNLLPPMPPDDAAAFLCFTNEDLYPGDYWLFVFGQATLEKRVGVWSLSRLGEPDKSAEKYKMFLARALKIAMHETGHMFTMLHCTKYKCLMSGSNHMGETDRHPLDVCPECAAKIAWGMKYEPQKRYKNLAEFWRRQGWHDEEKSFLAKAEAVEKAARK